MAGITVVSSVYGGYDAPAAPVPQDVDCEWVLVTDQQADCWPWKTIVEPRPHMHPRLAAKVAKCRPDLYSDTDVTVWVDGHVRITNPAFVRWATAPLEQGVDLAQIRHPSRQHIAAEAEVSVGLAKYAGLPIREQAAHYLANGYPDGWGLWATGIIARRNSPTVWGFGDAWLREQVRWTYQDQLSEAPLLWASGLQIRDLAGPLLGHWAFDLTQHKDGTL